MESESVIVVYTDDARNSITSIYGARVRLFGTINARIQCIQICKQTIKHP